MLHVEEMEMLQKSIGIGVCPLSGKIRMMSINT